MAQLKEPKWTLVQHSGFGYTGKEDFRRGVEDRQIDTEAQLKRVEDVGGIIFDTYIAASEAAMVIMYPGTDLSLIPKARGMFASSELDGLKIYIPTFEERDNIVEESLS